MDDDSRRLLGAALDATNKIASTADVTVTQIIKSGNVSLVYADDFIQALALSSEGQVFDALRLLKQKFTRDVNVPELRRRVVEAKQVIVQRSLASTNGHGRHWESDLIVTDQGKPRPILANAITALREAPEWKGVLAYDEFSLRTHKRKAPPFKNGSAEPGAWIDNDDRLTAEWLHHRGVFATTNVTAEAVEAVGRENPFHPVREYLTALKWDGIPRIETWTSVYLGSDDTHYERLVGPKWLISAVARVMQPGCKADHCLILEGLQGIGKSAALNILGSPWFTDQISDLGDKDSSADLVGKWIVELSELAQVRGKAVQTIRSFISRQEDHYRPSYGRRAIDSPRQCVFAGSTNEDRYLGDENNRRFWPVKCQVPPDTPTIDRLPLAWLARDRDQLWAEALFRYSEGVPWYEVAGESKGAVQAQQAARYETDSWEEIVRTWLNGPETRRNETSVVDVLDDCIKKPRGMWTVYDRSRVSRVLRSLGWVADGKRYSREEL